MPTDKQITRWTVKGWNDDHIELEDDEGKYVLYSDHVAAITAAEQAEPAPAARSGAVKVRELEWVRGWMNAEAQSEIGLYQIAYRRDGSFEWCFDIKREWASSWDAAKSAAQSDYEHRILAALETVEQVQEAQPEVDLNYERLYPAFIYDSETGNISPTIHEGWQLVPIEPSEEMLKAWQRGGGFVETWQAMLAAAPKPLQVHKEPRE